MAIRQWEWTATADPAFILSRSTPQNQAELVAALLAEIVSVTARTWGLVPYGVACDVLAALPSHEPLSIRVDRDTWSGHPRTFFWSFRAVSASGVVAIVGTLRGGSAEDACIHYARRQG